ncbi:MAG: hypothetical protein Q4B28_05100 [bacterium]|nr:hypothetical protein [bacterium]
MDEKELLDQEMNQEENNEEIDYKARAEQLEADLNKERARADKYE